MTDYTALSDPGAGWRTLVQGFPYENATQSETELQQSQAAAGMNKTVIAAIMAWAAAEHLIEPADELGRYRLTPMGRKSWRLSRDPV